MENVVASWLHGRSPSTQDAYRRDVEQFFDHAGCGIDEAQLEDVQAWADEMVLADLAASTRSRKLSALKSLYAFAHDHGHVETNPARSVKLPKVKDELASRILSEAEVIRIIALEEDERKALILRVLYGAGVRVAEICGLRGRDVTVRESGAVQLTVFGKGGKTRPVLIGGATAEELAELTYKLTPDDPLFDVSRSTVWRIVSEAADRAGIPKNVSPHWLRHAHASHALDRGAPVHLVKETLGHASLATTSRYAHARPNESSGKYLAL